jgi:hypothetical protein
MDAASCAEMRSGGTDQQDVVPIELHASRESTAVAVPRDGVDITAT